MRANTPTASSAEGKTVKIICVGKKGFELLRRQFGEQIIDFIDLRAVRQIGFEQADMVAQKVLSLFEQGEFDVATLFYSRFRSVMTQIPTAQQIVPAQLDTATRAASDAVYDYEPDEGEILTTLLPRNVSVQIFRALLENAASEQGARMSAMDSGDPQCRRDDQEADDDLQPVASGDDHQGTHRNHFGRRGALIR